MTKSIENAIVIGATGLVGRELVRQLSQNARCKNITAVVRQRDHELNGLAKVQQMVISDFLSLTQDDVRDYSHAFSCLGSTIKKAGSKDHFYQIDFSINAHFAELLEYYLKTLKLNQLSILKPSLLLGERHESRRLEDATQKLYMRFSHFVPDRFKFKPVTAQQVAHTMVDAAQTQTEKFEIYDNLRILTIK
ncbi:nucleoside-diphosphate sugar epimerase [Acinetobacter sp. YH12049]|uniref:nucleoside-diphosphate sugar epimerase n=1 Tax=Acinetobacter sp. YH12049 TaxID=2601054 RepID=UPI0015D185E7|nr:nucleoside-diphosphate sugar epimerase [Acinetobacter sp. YH12049]